MLLQLSQVSLCPPPPSIPQVPQAVPTPLSMSVGYATLFFGNSVPEAGLDAP